MKGIDRLIEAVRASGNPSAIGLDTRYEYIPENFAVLHSDGGRAGAIYEFNARLLRGLRDIIPCVKIQAAYYEMLGPDGMTCMARTIDEARSLDYVVIVDAKRGDIGATAEAYSAAYLGKDAPFRADFLTVNPYFGLDGIEPFVRDCAENERGIFVLVKTSNPSGRELQDLTLAGGRPMYELLAGMVSEWGKSLVGDEGYSSVGAVVGATYPVQGANLRKIMPRTFFLLPGYGAQGAKASDIAGCFDASGGGAIVAASRSLICAHKKKATDDFVQAARDEALNMRDQLSGAIRHARPG
ncbi:MAG: orotidine-5'-phosphate decarboxylase [Synergistaceae bacterium]|jgi:orotidine-5'-phosphate decarboxylase|nr:orotidine-5'-phosphate decarboxylase [Synergistaceae bacterium]